MTLRDDLTLIQEYYELVQADRAEILTCPRESAVMLYYVDHRTDEIYLKCTVCSHEIYPGAAWWNSLEDKVDNGRNNLG